MASEVSSGSETCGYCGEDAGLRCRQCKNMWYCSELCQQADWRAHKALCKTYLDCVNNRPAHMVRRGILLSKGKTEPMFLYLPCETGQSSVARSADVNENDDEDVVSIEDMEVRKTAEELGVPLFDHGNQTVLPSAGTFCEIARTAGASKMLVCGSRGGGQSLPYSVHAMDSRLVSGEQDASACLAHLLGAGMAAHWQGDVLIYAMTKTCDSSTLVDIDTRAFTRALDAMAAEISTMPLPPKKIMAVKVSAAEPHIQELDVPTAHPVFTKGPLSKVNHLMGGLPVRTYKQPALTPPPSDMPGTSSDGPINPAAWLHLNVDTTSPDFGSIPSEIKADPTTLLVAFAKAGNEFRDMDADFVDAGIGLIRDTIVSILRDTSKTPLVRCQEVREKGDAMFGLCLDTFMAALTGGAFAGTLGTPGSAGQAAGPQEGGGQANAGQQDASTSVATHELQQAAEPTTADGKGDKAETDPRA